MQNNKAVQSSSIQEKNAQLSTNYLHYTSQVTEVRQGGREPRPPTKPSIVLPSHNLSQKKVQIWSHLQDSTHRHPIAFRNRLLFHHGQTSSFADVLHLFMITLPLDTHYFPQCTSRTWFIEIWEQDNGIADWGIQSIRTLPSSTQAPENTSRQCHSSLPVQCTSQAPCLCLSVNMIEMHQSVCQVYEPHMVSRASELHEEPVYRVSKSQLLRTMSSTDRVDTRQDIRTRR